jgi:enoyl-CoA hydratase/carnithine racemase
MLVLTRVLQPVVIFEAVHSLRKMTLNRPAVLNALDSEMVSLIQPQLKVRASASYGWVQD